MEQPGDTLNCVIAAMPFVSWLRLCSSCDSNRPAAGLKGAGPAQREHGAQTTGRVRAGLAGAGKV
jgi:hypothetical protein